MITLGMAACGRLVDGNQKPRGTRSFLRAFTTRSIPVLRLLLFILVAPSYRPTSLQSRGQGQVTMLPAATVASVGADQRLPYRRADLA